MLVIMVAPAVVQGPTWRSRIRLSRVISALALIATILALLIALFVTSHGPPSIGSSLVLVVLKRIAGGRSKQEQCFRVGRSKGQSTHPV